jgi:cellulose synthase/poly-beta-1,6-N-acetylglucosamine synthase-like glycosyltransferase
MCDDGEMPVGIKRNKLLERSRGEYVCFIDDDDMVSADYIKLLYDNLLSYPDCLSLTGIIIFNGRNPRIFIHSINYKTLFESNNIYYRPPNHLSPMRRDIAIRFEFPSCYVGEDRDWCLQISNSGLLKNEVEIITPYYFYLCHPEISAQFAARKEKK